MAKNTLKFLIWNKVWGKKKEPAAEKRITGMITNIDLDIVF